MLTVGTHSAKIIDYGISKTKEGLPQLLVNFGIDSNGVLNRISWWGSFKEKAAPHTLKTLLQVFEMPCPNPGDVSAQLSKIAEQGKDSGLLNMEKNYDLVLEEQPDQAGKNRIRVRYVNNPGSGVGKFEKLAAAEAKNLFAGLAGVAAELKADSPGLFKAPKKEDTIPF